MTRRILKPQPEQARDSDGRLLPHDIMHVEGDRRPRITIGRVITRQEVRWATGDRLWVREAAANVALPGYPEVVFYRADDDARLGHATPPGTKWRPSIHMPRTWSRLTLIVTATKVERLQDITEDDAKAEGVYLHRSWGGAEWYRVDGNLHVPAYASNRARDTFAYLWASIHGNESWHDSPEVVAISFKVVRANIDAPEAKAA